MNVIIKKVMIVTLPEVETMMPLDREGLADNK